jgi:hypothetical protein
MVMAPSSGPGVNSGPETDQAPPWHEARLSSLKPAPDLHLSYCWWAILGLNI